MPYTQVQQKAWDTRGIRDLDQSNSPAHRCPMCGIVVDEYGLEFLSRYKGWMLRAEQGHSRDVMIWTEDVVPHSALLH